MKKGHALCSVALISKSQDQGDRPQDGDRREQDRLKAKTSAKCRTGQRSKDPISVFHHRNSTHQSNILNIRIVVLVKSIITNKDKYPSDRDDIISFDIRISINKVI